MSLFIVRESVSSCRRMSALRRLVSGDKVECWGVAAVCVGAASKVRSNVRSRRLARHIQLCKQPDWFQDHTSALQFVLRFANSGVVTKSENTKISRLLQELRPPPTLKRIIICILWLQSEARVH